MVLAIEPMTTTGTVDVQAGEDGWAIYSADGSLAAHFEFTVAITPDGPRILTPWHRDDATDSGVANIVGRARAV
jgi:methionyl aminopeptidase